MRRAVRVRLVAVLLSCLASIAARADGGPIVPVHVGTHPGFGRVTFDLPERLDYRVTQQGQHVLVRFTGDVMIGAAPSLPRNVLGATGGDGQADLVIASGTAVHAWRLGNLVVVDVLDQAAATGAPPIQGTAPTAAAAGPLTPTASAAKQPSAAATTAAVPAVSPVASPVASPLASPAASPLATPPAAQGPPVAPARSSAPAAASPASAPSPAAAPTQAVPPVPPPKAAEAPAGEKAQPTPSPMQSTEAVAAPAAVAAMPLPEFEPPVRPVTDTPAPSVQPPDPVLEIRFETAVGVAAFRRGNAALVVFDQSLPVDLAPLRDDPTFGTAIVQQLPAATVVRFRLDPGKAVALSQGPHAWRITPVPVEPKLQPIHAKAADGRLVLPAAAPGRVVNLADPDTGAVLLVGTQLQAGQGVPALRRTVEFLLMPTWQGVALEPISDDLALRPAQDGFVLSGGAAGQALSPATDAASLMARSDALTRRFDFAALPPDALLQRLRRQFVDNSAAPALGRGPGRRAAAQTLISLGLGAEAQSLLKLAAADDPHEAEAADTAALTGMAAVLAQRADEAAGLDDERLSGTDDIALWRAVRLAERQEEGSPQAAAVFAATLPLVVGYPFPLRDRLLPLVAETLAAGGETAAASALLAEHKDDPALGLARGMLLEALGDTTAALARNDALASATDPRLYARSAVRALELRLASGEIGVKQAADGLDRLLYGGAHERSLRDRVAELRARSGAWRTALSLIRETEAIFPADKVAIHAELADMFAAMLRSDAEDSLAPLELIAMVDENADLLPTGAAGDALQARLADRLLTLDLPKRAEPVLQKLMQAAPSDVSRATFGARLAALRLREGDATGALATLAASQSDAAPDDLAERRTLLLAAAHARLGETERALAALASLDTASADEARATILERANDWAGAEKALNAYVAKAVPAEGRLDDGQRRTMLRLATAAARAGDDATLATLRQSAGPRMETGPVADMFRLLTADQVRGVGDLKRSGLEAGLARGLPGQLNAAQPPPRQIP